MDPKPNQPLDIAANRRAVKYAPRELALRIGWALARPLYRLSPRPFWFLRNAMLRAFGAKIGDGVRIDPSAAIIMPWNLVIGDWSAIGPGVLIYNLGPVTIGARVTISHRAHLCAGTHDHTRADFPLLKPPIEIHSDAWVCADAFVGPGVVIGEGAIVAARGVAVADVSPWTIVAGNPARHIGERTIHTAPEDSSA